MTPGSGNVLADFGLTQAEAGRLLGLDQPKTAAIVKGRIDGNSTDRLLRFVTRLGPDIRIITEPPPQSSSKLSL